ncbi:MAG: OB-fold domain-containing protein [Chloroflexota bacterium]
MTSPRPLPQPDPLTQPFWDAASGGRLVVQRCGGCGYYNHPPRPLCDHCSSQDLSFEPVSGRGTLYSFTVMRQRNVAGFEEEVPYLNLLVELEEQPLLFMISRLPGSAVEGLAIGQPMEVFFEPADEGIALPQFRPVAGGA